ncbi:hypothetical protein IW15_01235 [Chryseobacterium soli]|uniref:Outer membrane protein n=1 Tax=Chryseobacterium soli TaxID=445961 RepID=A0A086ABN7_9FLAO|nr:hypothetical protein [Chryseobacterium soli]KFF14101.1 hypothetical protein IW15_01235 [Chryseobacterium soli]
MNKLLPILAGILILVPHILFSQQSQNRKQTSQPDSITFDNIAFNKAITNLLFKSFSTVATGQGEANNFATYASFEPANGSYKFNAFGSAGTGERPFLFNISVKGDIIGDNVGVLFNNSKFNIGTTISGKIHIPLKGMNINIEGYDRQLAINKVKTLKKMLDEKLTDLKINNSLAYLNNQMSNYNNRWNEANVQYTQKKNSLDSLNLIIDNERKKRTDEAKLDPQLKKSLNLTKELKALDKSRSDYRFKIDSVKTILEASQTNKNYYRSKDRLEKAFKLKSDSVYLAIPILAQSTPWLSFIGSYNRSKYYTFDNTLLFSDQLKTVVHNNFQYGAELNWFISTSPYWPEDKPNTKPKPVHIHLINFGVVRIGASDIDDYSTTEMTQTKKSVLDDTTNSLGKKYNVYTDPITEYKAWRIYANYYYFLGKGNTMAIHPFAELQFRDTHENPFALGLGFVKSLKNKKDNAVINIEIYAKFKDIGRALPQKNVPFYNRNEIGINFAIPLNLPKK